MCTAASFPSEENPINLLNLSHLSHEIRAGIQKSYDDFVEHEKKQFKDAIPDGIKGNNENLVNNVSRTEPIGH